MPSNSTFSLPASGCFHVLLMLFCLLLSTLTSHAQWKILDLKTPVHMRAVHAVSSNICWMGGSGGTVLKTLDGGHSFATYKIAGADSLDFRDIHAFDRQTALAMSAGEGQKGKAKIYRTEDGGSSWNLVYQTTQTGAFLDGIDFWDKNRGICLGDPLEGRLFVLTTEDGGRSWQELPMPDRPQAEPGEACFAASGTSILAAGKSSAYIGTGGSKMARVFRSEDYGRSWNVSATPLPAGPTSGIFGLRFWSKKNGIAVGGDYKNTTDSTKNVLTTKDGGVTWTLESMTKPAGLKECVVLYHKTNPTWNGDTQIRADNYALIATGPSGSSYSLDKGATWSALGKEPFHAVSFAGHVGYAVGGKGLIGKIEKIPTKKKKRTIGIVEQY